MLRAIAVIVVALVGAAGSYSGDWQQQSGQAAKSVTNADVVSMTATKLSDDVIVGAIQQAATADFDLSPAALIALRNAGVSDRVLQAMQARAKSSQSSEKKPNPNVDSRSSEPCRIFITDEDPPSRFYVVVRKEVQVANKFYGQHDDNLMRELAKQADKAGSDAIIKFHEWRAPSGFSWAAAKAGGMAVKWTAEGKTSVSTIKGKCWSPVAKALGLARHIVGDQ